MQGSGPGISFPPLAAGSATSAGARAPLAIHIDKKAIKGGAAGGSDVTTKLRKYEYKSYKSQDR